jgi:transposase InsO family protein
MDNKKREEIALFRYGIIAPCIHESVKSQMRYFRDMSLKEFDLPYIGRRRYKVSAFKCWLRNYKIGGIDALKPRERLDKGKSRKIDPEVGEGIKKRVEKYPFLSCAAIYRLLISEGIIGPSDITEGTLRKYISDNNLNLITTEPQPRKKFEKEHINMLWISDFMHGPYIISGGKKRKVYLCCIIDDHSRVIVSGRFFLYENSISLEMVLKEGITRFGLPNVFYCDNGSVYSSSHLQLACARLGISLVHSRPYDSPSRGKIERLWRTIREKFLSLLRLQDIVSIEELNRLFELWVDKEYNKGYHHGIDMRPMDKYMADIKDTVVKRISQEEFDTAFLRTIKRMVKNDSTISFEGIVYEVPTRFIGKFVEIRYPIDKSDSLTIYEDDKPVCKINRINLVENANLPVRGIRFKKEED